MRPPSSSKCRQRLPQYGQKEELIGPTEISPLLLEGGVGDVPMQETEGKRCILLSMNIARSYLRAIVFQGRDELDRWDLMPCLTHLQIYGSTDDLGVRVLATAWCSRLGYCWQAAVPG